MNGRVIRVDSCNDRRREDGDPASCDVVEQEDPRHDQGLEDEDVSSTAATTSKWSESGPLTFGLKTPALILATSMLSKVSVVPTFSDLTRAIATSLSSGVSHLAVAGLSVKMK